MIELTEEDFVIAVLNSDEVIQKKSLQEINSIPNVKYRLIAKYNKTYFGPSNTTKWYHYQIINEKGEFSTIKIGNYEIIYIDNDNGCTKFFGRKIQIHDILRNYDFTYTSMYNGIWFIPKELIPVLNELNRIGSWEAYSLSIKLEKIEAQCKELEEENNSLAQKVSLFRTSYEALRKDYAELHEEYQSFGEKINVHIKKIDKKWNKKSYEYIE